MQQKDGHQGWTRVLPWLLARLPSFGQTMLFLCATCSFGVVLWVLYKSGYYIRQGTLKLQKKFAAGLSFLFTNSHDRSSQVDTRVNKLLTQLKQYNKVVEQLEVYENRILRLEMELAQLRGDIQWNRGFGF